VARRRAKLDRHFKRRPGALLAVRLTFFGAFFLTLPLIAVLNGWMDLTRCRPWRRPWSCDDGIYFAEHPIGFSIIVALFVVAALFMLAVSIVAYRKQREALSTPASLSSQPLPGPGEAAGP
jgi:hypothetical protein